MRREQTAAARTRPVLEAGPGDVRLVLVGGVALYGDDVLQPIALAPATCEAFDACGESQFVCVAMAGGTATNPWGQTLAEITTVLSGASTAYDAMDLSSFDFAPITPLLECP